LLLTLLLLYTLHLEKSNSYLAWMGYGLLWSVTALTSAATLATLPFFGLWLIARHTKARVNWFGPAVASGLVFLAVVAPWTVRNSRLYGRFVPFRGNLGLEIMVGNTDPDDPSNWKYLPGENPAQFAELIKLGEPAYMAEKKRQGMEIITQHFGFYAV